jgi:hypothetical protein
MGKDDSDHMSKRRKWSKRPTGGNGKAPKAAAERRRVAILLPSMEVCNLGFTISLAKLMRDTALRLPPNIEALTINSFCSSMLPFSRQMLAETALSQGATHLLWIDSDMDFPADMLLRFLQFDHPIVGINAMARRDPWRNTAQSAPNVPLVTTPNSNGLERVYRTGFGVMWMEASILGQMEKPWFPFKWMPELGVFRGEDYGFCEKAKELGYEIYIDHDISKQVYHVGQFGYNPQMAAISADTLAEIVGPDGIPDIKIPPDDGGIAEDAIA